MRTAVKEIAFRLLRRPVCSPLTVALLDASRVEQAFPAMGVVDLLAASADAPTPPEWVRFLVPGENRSRDGRVYFVADVERVVQLSTTYKGSIELLIDFEHQFDRAPENGKPVPAAAWITELSAKGPDGTPGVWAKVDWLPETAELIRSRKYRYLSAAVAHDASNVVQFVPRASLTNQPALDTASALFSVQPTKENDVNFFQKVLAALGLAATTTEDDAVKHATALATLCAALAKQLGVEISVLSTMTGEQIATMLSKPLADKIATLSATAKVAADASPDAITAGIRGLGVDPAQYIARSAYDDVANRLATLTAESKGKLIEQAMKDGKLTPAMKSWADSLDHAQLTSFLSTAAVIVAPNGGGGGGAPKGATFTVATLTVEHKAEADKFGVSYETYAAQLNERAASAT